MEKNILGDWGAGLDPAGYAQAIAALGVLESSQVEHPSSDDPQEIRKALEKEFQQGERTVTWCGRFDPASLDLAAWQAAPPWDPAKLAEAWRLLLQGVDHPRIAPRLGVRAGWDEHKELLDLQNLLDWLAMREVGLLALVIVPEGSGEDEARDAWHWPVRIGIPEDDPVSAAGLSGQELLARLQPDDYDWMRELAQLQPVGAAREACDLLILPPGMAARLAALPSLRLRASFIICLDAPVPGSLVLDTPAAQLMKRTGAAGVALVGRPEQPDPSARLEGWYRELARNLSHDLPVHAAVWDVGFWKRILPVSLPPVILGYPQALDRLRILRVAEQLDRKAAENWQTVDFGLPTPGEGAPARPSGPLARNVRSAPFTSEEGYGVPAARQFAETEGQLEQAAQPRWMQAKIWPDETAKQPAKALAPDRPSLVSFFIGPTDEERDDEAFPDQKIDYRDGPVTVHLQVELAGAALAAAPWKSSFRGYLKRKKITLSQALASLLAAPAPAGVDGPLLSVASKRILLPSTGSSDLAEFAVWPQPNVTEVTGRVSVIHQNRIIQTAKFTAPVGIESEVTQKATLQTEQVVHPSMSDLGDRREFDAALMVDDLGGCLHVTVFKDGQSKVVELDDLQQVIADIRNTILEVTYRQEDTQDLTTSADLRNTLLSLSYHGSLLYQNFQESLGELLDQMERIQISSKVNFFFPLEYLYGGPALDLDAQVCPEAPKSLREGVCKCSFQGSPAHICPLQFWGFSKVIERHVQDPEDQPEEQSAAGTPSPARTPFGAVSPVVFAASERAFNFPDGATWKNRLIEILGRVGGGQPPGVAEDWKGWRSLIDTNPGPKLLVLLPHSDTVMSNIEVLEIGANNQLPKTRIDKELVGAEQIPQLLLLIGCSTAEVTESFASYPKKFYDQGADIIIAPIAPILGADAAPIACRISELLVEQTTGQGEVAFGELLRQIRRELLADGHPGVLGLISFGDADWTFGG